MSEPRPSRAILLLARAAIGAMPTREIEQLRDRLAARLPDAGVEFAFVEQGEPSLRAVVARLVDGGCAELQILALLVPAEPSFPRWLVETLARWRAADARAWPAIRIGQLGADHPAADALVDGLLQAAATAPPVPLLPGGVEAGGSVVPAQKRRVLVCAGAPCHAAGAMVVWGHLRNEQKRLSLRTVGDGTHTARATCLGPCKLAPVVQVWPEGTYYGGVDEAGIDRIIAEHLLEGRIVEDLAYRPTGAKQSLRG